MHSARTAAPKNLCILVHGDGNFFVSQFRILKINCSSFTYQGRPIHALDKKVCDFPVPIRDAIYQTLPGGE